MARYLPWSASKSCVGLPTSRIDWTMPVTTMRATLMLAARERRVTTGFELVGVEGGGGEQAHDDERGDPQCGGGVVGDVEREPDLGPSLGGGVAGPGPGAQHGEAAERQRAAAYLVVDGAGVEQQQPQPAGEQEPDGHRHAGAGAERGVERAE